MKKEINTPLCFKPLFVLVFTSLLLMSSGCNIPILEILPSSLELNKAATELMAGSTEDLVAKATFENIVLDTPNLEWSSSDTTVVTVDQNGQITAVSVGTANISVCVKESPTLCSTVKVTITSHLSSFTLIPTIKTIFVDQQFQFSSLVQPTQTGTSTVYASNDSTIAIVSSSGLLTGISPGTTTITGTITHAESASNLVAMSAVTVVARPPITPTASMTLNNLEIATTQTSSSINMIRQDGTIPEQVTFVSSDPTVGTVNENGQITGIAEGIITITATDIATEEVATTSVSITQPTGTRPIASAVQVQVYEDREVPIKLNGFDPQHKTLTYEILSLPEKGSISGTLPNITYTPNTDYAGTDSFSFKVNNGTEDSLPTTVTVFSMAINDPPEDIIVPSDIKVSENTNPSADNGGTIVGTFDATDIDSSVLSYILPEGGDNQNHLFSMRGRNLILNQNIDYETTRGTVSVSVMVSDGTDSYEETILIPVTDEDDPPTGISVETVVPANSKRGTRILLTVLDDDTNPEYNENTITLTSGEGDEDNNKVEVTADGTGLSLTEDLSASQGDSLSVHLSVLSTFDPESQEATIIFDVQPPFATDMTSIFTSSDSYDASDIVAHDFDNDNDIDIAFAADETLYLLINDGNGNFAPPVAIFSYNSIVLFNGYHNIFINLEDFNNDGLIDIVLSSWSETIPIILMQNQNNTFDEHYIASASTGLWHFKEKTLRASIGDIDNDGDKDIIWSSSYDPDLIIALNDNGSFRFTLVESKYYPFSILIFDTATPSKIILTKSDGLFSLNNEQKMWEELGNYYWDWNYVWTHEYPSLLLSHPSIDYYYSSDLIDIDGDGDKDILSVVNKTDHSSALVAFMYNDQTDTFNSDPYNIHDGLIEMSRVYSDLNNDGFLDLIYVESEFNTAFYKLSLATASPTYADPIQIGSGIRFVTTNDIDLDGDEDIILNGTSGVYILTNNIAVPPQNQYHYQFDQFDFSDM